MRRDHAPIVGIALRVTDDPRTNAAALAWLKVEQKLVEARAWLASANRAPLAQTGPDLYFGSAAK